MYSVTEEPPLSSTGVIANYMVVEVAAKKVNGSGLPGTSAAIKISL